MAKLGVLANASAPAGKRPSTLCAKGDLIRDRFFLPGISVLFGKARNTLKQARHGLETSAPDNGSR